VAALMHSDVRRRRSSVLAEATPVRLLAARAALVASDVRRLSSSVLAEPTPVRPLAAVAALVCSDGRHLSSSVLAEVTPVRLLAAVAALVYSDGRRPRRSVLAEPTPESLHIGSATPVVVVVAICSTRAIAVAAHPTTSSTNHNQIISQHQRTGITAALHTTGHRQSRHAQLWSTLQHLGCLLLRAAGSREAIS
jgi:hypothetical protein